MKLLLPLLLGAAAAAVRVAGQPQAFDCPSSSCWCGDSFSEDQVELRPEIYYRTAFNRVTQANQTLFLDEWLAPSSTPRPGALIIHGGGYSTGPFNGCSHAKNMSSFADVAMALARRGFAVVSIDYRCEGPLRAGDPADLFHPWFDAVEDARAAVRYMVSNAARLQLDSSRIVAFGGSAGAVTVAQLLHALPEGTPMPAPVPPPPDNCTQTLRSQCPRSSFAGYEACLTCTRQHAAAPTCKPRAREAYCNRTAVSAPDESAPVGGNSNVTCGISLSGAIPPGSIAAGQVSASPDSPPYLDFHGTADATVPYSNTTGGPADRGLLFWGNALDTKSWLDSKSAPNSLVSIPGAGHVPFEALPPCADPEAFGCYSTSFFGFLLEAMRLAGVKCPAALEKARSK